MIIAGDGALSDKGLRFDSLLVLEVPGKRSSAGRRFTTMGC